MPEPLMNPDSLFHYFENQRVMVVGDVMLDRYVTGKANRISPEAPVPILEFEREENRLCGAANVALNLLALGASPILCGLVGFDLEGDIFQELMDAEGLDCKGIVASPDRCTTVKTRIVAGKQQLLRLDKENTFELNSNETLRFLENTLVLFATEAITCLILQDYNKGVLTEKVINKMIHEARKRRIPICVDPKSRNFWSYQGVDLFKPNLKEVSDALLTRVRPMKQDLQLAAAAIRAKNKCKTTLITLSEHGVFLDDGQLSEIFPTKPRNVADVCGAGDTVISVASLALVAGLSSQEIALLANLAGGQVVEKNGVVTIDKEQLRRELLQLLMEA